MIVLDTHVVYWLAAAPEKLSRAATRAIERAAASTGLGISTISLWELAMLVTAGRIRVKATTLRFLDAIVQTPGLSLLDITPEIAALSAQFPTELLHDPADRLICATARAQDGALVTKDGLIQDSALVRTVW